MTEPKSFEIPVEYPSREGVRVYPEGLRMAQIIEDTTTLLQTDFKAVLVPPEGEITQADAEKVQQFLLAAFPPDGRNYRTHNHLQTTAKFAAAIAEKRGLNPHEFYIAGLLHDVGRLMSHPDGTNPHRYFRNDLLASVLHKSWKVPDLIAKIFQPRESYVKPEEFKTMDALTDEQRILVLADICGKRTDTNQLKSFEETLKYHFESRGFIDFKSIWPSETAAKSVTSAAVVKQWGDLYVALATWCKDTTGVSVEQITAEIEQAEKQLPITTVVWDIGGVFIENTDPAIIEDFCSSLGITDQQLHDAWAVTIPDYQRGISSQVQFWSALEKQLKKLISPELRNTLFTRYFSTTADPAMLQVVEDLRQSGITNTVLSDTIPEHAKALWSSGLYDKFRHVCLSPDIVCSKKSGSSFQNDSPMAAFHVAALQAGVLASQCIFLDDRTSNVDLALKAGMKAGQVTSVAEAMEVLKKHGLLS